jgi:hypothetical protein
VNARDIIRTPLGVEATVLGVAKGELWIQWPGDIKSPLPPKAKSKAEMESYAAPRLPRVREPRGRAPRCAIAAVPSRPAGPPLRASPPLAAQPTVATLGAGTATCACHHGRTSRDRSTTDSERSSPKDITTALAPRRPRCDCPTTTAPRR